MNSIENELRRVMAEHDRQAPSVADLLSALERSAQTSWPGPSGRRASWHVPLLAAAAVAAVIAGSVWAGTLLTGHRRIPPSSPLSCPARHGRATLWVPDKPSGVNGRSRLVPQRTPASALICAYAGTNMGPPSRWRLSGRRLLASGLARLAAQLSWQPRELRGQATVCTLIGGPQTDYLIGLAYPGGGTIWVATALDPNHCIGTSNGQFSGIGVVGQLVQQAFASGRWPPRPVASCKGRITDDGRLGQETAMVPAGSTTLVICNAHLSRVIRAGYGPLVTALNSLPTSLSTRGCSQRGPSRLHYQLLFAYPKGPPVVVDVMKGCFPEIDNFSLQSGSANRIFPIIGRLVHPG